MDAKVSRGTWKSGVTLLSVSESFSYQLIRNNLSFLSSYHWTPRHQMLYGLMLGHRRDIERLDPRKELSHTLHRAEVPRSKRRNGSWNGPAFYFVPPDNRVRSLCWTVVAACEVHSFSGAPVVRILNSTFQPGRDCIGLIS